MRAHLIAFILAGWVAATGGLPSLAQPRLIGGLPRLGDRPLEAVAGVETQYGSLRTGDGSVLRTIVTRPAGARGPLPLIYYAQWLSCDSVEISGEDGWSQMLRTLVRDSGMAVARVEKSGVGDSVGRACAALDYHTEVAHHQQGLDAMLNHPWVDKTRVYLFGASMGSREVARLGQDRALRGVMIWGGGGATWFERQLLFQRHAWRQDGGDMASLDRRMTGAARVYADWLLGGVRPPQQITADAARAAVWRGITGSSPDGQFGRPFAFHEQAERQDVLAEWAKIRAPVLVMLGEADWFEDLESAQLVADTVRAHGQRAQLASFPRLDHHFNRYSSNDAVYAGEKGVPDPKPVTDTILAWLSAHP
jgi:pimeloyl-ACP methyl ester carboxylesterase